MLTHWNKLINTDCVVVEIGDYVIYPIYRSGSSSLLESANKILTNQQITDCENIHVLIRNPEDRFRSGLDEYCRQNNLNLKNVWQDVSDGKFIDRHFAPHWLWLLHLHKYYKGPITLRPFESINNYCKAHVRADEKHRFVPVLKQFVEIDYKLLQHMNETIKLENLIRKYKNVLS